MSSSMVTTQMKSLWGKSVEFSDRNPKFNATKARKFAVTKTRKERPEIKSQLAELMSLLYMAVSMDILELSRILSVLVIIMLIQFSV